MKRIVFVFFLFLALDLAANIPQAVNGSKADSLKSNLLEAAEEDKIEILFDLYGLYKNNADSSLGFLIEAIQIAEKLGLKEKEIDAKVYLAMSNLTKRDFDKALNSLIEISEESLLENYYKGYVNAMIAIGNTYLMLNSYDKALNYFLTALKYAEKNDYKAGYISCLSNIGIVYSMNNENEKALENFFSVMKIFEEKNDSVKIANSYVNIGNVYFAMEDYENSIKYLSKAVEIFETQNNPYLLASALGNAGNAYMELNDNESALYSYNKALQISKSLNDSYSIASISVNLGTYYLDVDDLEQAEQHFNLSMQLAANSKDIMKLCYEGLSIIYTEKGDYKKAIGYVKLFEQYEDSIYNQESQQRIAELKIQYSLEKKEQEIELLEMKTRLKDKQAIILLIITIALLASAILIFYFFKARNVALKQRNLLLLQQKQLDDLKIEKNKIEKLEQERENQLLLEELKANEEISRLKFEKYTEEIKHKNRELAASTLQIVNKNEILDSIKKSLKKKQLDSKESNEFFSQLIKDVENSIDTDKDWDKFKIHFENVHQGFFDRLSKNYPSLTLADHKLCAYLRINLDNKEISKIINITLATLQKRRHRLRKKLSLDSDINLVEFLNKI